MATDDACQDDYFIGYGDLSVHELMLKDRPRTQAYRKFIEDNLHLLKDKIVMDVGAGTGILSLFAASAGAKKVLAVEASSVARLCQEIVQENNLNHIIEVIHGTVETISLPSDIRQVDVIISEWMGFYLLHESMLDSVIVARDRFLAPGGVMLPSHASLLFAPVDMSDHFQNRADEWSNIYGFDFSPVASQINMEEVTKPLITSLNPNVLCADPQEIINLNLKTVTAQDIQTISTVLKFPMRQDSKVFGFAAWFNVEFNPDCDAASKSHVTLTHESADSRDVHDAGDGCLLKDPYVSLHSVEKSSQEAPATISSVLLKTGPHDLPTHWKQTVVFLPRTILVQGGVDLCCRVRMSQSSSNKRHYNITVTLVDESDDDDGETSDASDDSTDHPVPCACGSDRCRLISALVDKYADEHDELVDEVVEGSGQVGTTSEMEEDLETDGQQEGPSS
ncbi:unnamed protein product [Candidula unifasciata]|uniref:type I protein arginine methyltransferase n=1 Tax=Candidula unifasciata TaxID=100452 RepID=A0A8S3YRQ5_9EUPU|nr:unnamed protein product [Candidula unifasciata]